MDSSSSPVSSKSVSTLNTGKPAHTEASCRKRAPALYAERIPVHRANGPLPACLLGVTICNPFSSQPEATYHLLDMIASDPRPALISCYVSWVLTKTSGKTLSGGAIYQNFVYIDLLSGTQEKSDSAAGGGRKPAAGEHITEAIWLSPRHTARIGRKIQNPASTRPSPQSSPPRGEEASRGRGGRSLRHPPQLPIQIPIQPKHRQRHAPVLHFNAFGPQ